MAAALARAERVLGDQLGFSLGKKQHCETVAWPKHRNGYANPCVDVKLKKGKVDKIGRVYDQYLGKVHITLVDQNKDGLYDSYIGWGTFTTVPYRQLYGPGVFLRHPATANAAKSCSYQRFEASQIYLKAATSGGVFLRVVGPLHEILKPDIISADEIQRAAPDPCLYAKYLNAYRRVIKTDESAYGISLASCGGCNACSTSATTECSVCSKITACVVNHEQGIVRLTADSSCDLNELTSATIYYLGGDCCENWEQIVVRMAVADLGVEAFQIPSYFVQRWGSVDSKADNPLGDRAGHEYAWRFIQENRAAVHPVILA